jgi:phosphoglycerate dehydrogenase-like enzyme
MGARPVKVLITYGPLSEAALAEIGAAADGAEIRYAPEKGNDAFADPSDNDVDIAFMNALPRSIDHAAALRWVQVASSGVNTFRSSPAWNRPDVTVTTAGGIAANSIAEYVIAMILVDAHRFDAATAIKAARAWPADEDYPRLASRPVHGQTLGILGFGNVGRRLAYLGRGLGMNVLAMRRTTDPPRPRYPAPGIEYASESTDGVTVLQPGSLRTLLEEADHLAVAVPRTTETEGILGEGAFARMKSGSHLINPARGGIVDEVALADALALGRPASASIDVTDVEPPSPDLALYRAPNVRLTPHIAGYFENYEDAAARLFAANLRRDATGEVLYNVVDRAAGY